MPSFKIIGLLVLEMKIFTIYGHDGLLGQVPCTIYINFLSHFSREIHIYFTLIGQLVSEMFENNGLIRICIQPMTGADKPRRSFFSLIVLFSQYSPLLQVFSPLNDFKTVFPIQTYNLTLYMYIALG